MSALQVILTEEQLDSLAEKVAQRMGSPLGNKPFSLQKAADAIGICRETLRLRVHSGRVIRVPDTGSRILIPRAEVERLQRAEKGESR